MNKTVAQKLKEQSDKTRMCQLMAKITDEALNGNLSCLTNLPLSREDKEYLVDNGFQVFYTADDSIRIEWRCDENT